MDNDALAVGQTVTVSVSTLAFGGEGVTRVGGHVGFIWGALPGEEVQARVTQVKKNFFRATATEILRASAQRVTPPCPYFGRCGGCQLQHAGYALQVSAKAQQVADILTRIGGVSDPPLEPIVASPQPYRYRHTLTLKVVPGSLAALGLVAQAGESVGASDRVPIERCELAQDPVNKSIASALRHVRQKLPQNVWNQGEVVIRGGLGGVEAGWIPLGRRGKGQRLPMARLQVLDRVFQVPLDGFFQANLPVTEMLVRRIRDWLSQDPPAALVDLYSGVGLFSILLSSLARSVVGVENDATLVRAARQNAKDLGERVRFEQGDAVRVCEALVNRLTQPIAVVMDPPRMGLAPDVVGWLNRTRRVAQVVYVSCEPTTLARDLSRLDLSRWRLAAVAPFDMFPQTQHVEVAVWLKYEGERQ